MKLFFISDIHGSELDLEWALKKFEKEKADYLLILGDQMYHGPRNPLPKSYNPPKVSEMLNKYKDKIVAVRGNCDSEVDQMLLEYPILGDYSTILIDGRRFFLTHGHIYNRDNMPNLVEGDILCYGHTHLPLAEEQEGIILFNPGSITLPKGGYEKSYGIYEKGNLKVLDINDKEIVSYKF
jgi:hypothetical protein